MKRKKLIEIETKIDSLLQVLDSQTQIINDMEKSNRQFLYELLNEKIEVLSGENQRRIEDMVVGFKEAKAEIFVLFEQCGEVIRDLCEGQKQHDNAVKKELNAIKQEIKEEQKIKKEITDKLELAENEILENQTQIINDMEKSNRQFLYEFLNEKAEMLSRENQRRIEDMEAELKDFKSEISASVEQGGEIIKDLCEGQKQHDNAVKKELNAIKQEIKEEQKIKKEITDKLELAENEIRMLLVNSVMDQIP